KSQRAIEEARMLNDARNKTGLSFNGALFDLAASVHQPIAHHFGTDAGMRLMRYDSDIALAVMGSFAEQGIPILGVHDSFIVPRRHEPELRETMVREYVDLLGFVPVVH